MSKRSELVETIVQVTGLDKKTADAMLITVGEALRIQLTKEGETLIPGFGRFSVKDVAARKGHNPKTGEPIDIPAKVAVKFKAFPGALGVGEDDGVIE